MSGIVISMPVRQRAHVAPQRVQMDFGTLLGRLDEFRQRQTDKALAMQLTGPL